MQSPPEQLPGGVVVVVNGAGWVVVVPGPGVVL
jgi:hypothetical protein